MGYTTVMVQCVPFDWTRDQLHDMLQVQAPKSFDFLYLPYDPLKKQNKGFAFINFVDTRARYWFERTFNGVPARNFMDTDSPKVFAVVRAAVQGKTESARLFLKGEIAGKSAVQPDWRPIVYYGGLKSLVSQWAPWQ
eukprot:TRINITY_DN5174_c0_g1_i2.p2 TRINITY_DN5174_c0_g1~~TRINITY_DN5174_c0_g1_i2.p2  ORF type:complete len:137 (-),score=1.84 TRINITY_DN5174_c0_g1_i2:52-462(-)